MLLLSPGQPRIEHAVQSDHRFSEILKGELFGRIGHLKYNGHARILRHSAQRLNAMVDTALSLGKAGLQPQSLELNAEIERAVEAFQLATTKKSQVEGSGLGLHLSKSLAQAMGAAFAVRSSGNGTTITLGLPLTERRDNLRPLLPASA